MNSPFSPLMLGPIPRPDGLRRVLFAHAHPDDETLATGCLIADLVGRGVEVGVVTATRGERGQVREGTLAHLAGTDALVEHRAGELAEALRTLGVGWHAVLGTPPARAAGLPPRVYRDSGMRWLTATLAGPAEDVTPDALTSADVQVAAVDLAAAVTAYHPDLLVSYDITGGYGHPDHVRMHAVTLTAAELTGVPTAELVMPGGDTPDLHLPGRQTSSDEALTWFDLPETLPTVQAALAAYGSQLRVEGRDVVHVGERREPIVTKVGLRRVR